MTRLLHQWPKVPLRVVDAAIGISIKSIKGEASIVETHLEIIQWLGRISPLEPSRLERIGVPLPNRIFRVIWDPLVVWVCMPFTPEESAKYVG